MAARITRDSLERHQVWAYLAAIALGLGLGSVAPGLARTLDGLVWPLLALLLFVTFTQIKLADLPVAFKDTRFVAAVLAGNFVVLPFLVWGLLALAPNDPAIRFGLVLVLLVPCTDWFVTFAHQAGGDTARAVSITPILLLAQMLCLPLYLWGFLGVGGLAPAAVQRMALVFAVIIVVPIALAFLIARWAGDRAKRKRAVARLGALPVPLLALVLFLITASQVEIVMRARHLFGPIMVVCLVFLAGAVVLALAIGKLFRLPLTQSRTLLFSMSTRNSFVVLPFALALPADQQAAAIVVVLQSLVELLGMLVLLWLVPKRLLRQH